MPSPIPSLRRGLRRALVATIAGGCAAAGALPGSALADPPANDGYLQSIRLVDASGHLIKGPIQDLRDTSEATVQSDLFAPAGTGGGVEPTTTPSACGAVSYGKTVWYDFTPPTTGAVDLQASGVANVVVLYAFDPTTSRLGPEVACTSASSATDMVQRVAANTSYTVQVGGVDGGLGPAGGSLTFGFEFFADADADGVLDALDKCPKYPGQERFGGCPATVDARAFVTLISSGGHYFLTRVRATGSSGTRVVVRCARHCRGQWSTKIGASRATVVDGLRKVRVRVGTTFDVLFTKPGLFGRFLHYTVRASGLRTTFRCLLPVEDPKPRTRCKGSTAAP